jgi:hypothetical protein
MWPVYLLVIAPLPALRAETTLSVPSLGERIQRNHENLFRQPQESAGAFKARIRSNGSIDSQWSDLSFSIRLTVQTYLSRWMKEA